MITLRRDSERHHDRGRRQETWFTFGPHGRPDPLAPAFWPLENLDEGRLAPRTSIPRHTHRDAETITYVREGTLTQQDSMGRSGVIHAGEFQRVAAGFEIRHTEANTSRVNGAHVFKVWFRPSKPGLEPSQEQKRFCTAERRGGLCVIGSPDGRRGSLRIHQDAFVYSAILDVGHHVVHELAEGRRAWLHVVGGELLLGDDVLRTGDGAAVTGERAISLTARGEVELLLLDLAESAPPLS